MATLIESEDEILEALIAIWSACIIVFDWTCNFAAQINLLLLTCTTTLFKFGRRNIRPLRNLHLRLAALAMLIIQLLELEEPVLLIIKWSHYLFIIILASIANCIMTGTYAAFPLKKKITTVTHNPAFGGRGPGICRAIRVKGQKKKRQCA